MHQKILYYTADSETSLDDNPGLEYLRRQMNLTEWARQLKNTHRSMPDDLEFAKKEWRKQLNGVGLLDK